METFSVFVIGSNQGYVSFLQPLPRLLLDDLPPLVPCDQHCTEYRQYGVPLPQERPPGCDINPRVSGTIMNLGNLFIANFYTIEQQI